MLYYAENGLLSITPLYAQTGSRINSSLQSKKTGHAYNMQIENCSLNKCSRVHCIGETDLELQTYLILPKQHVFIKA